MEAGPHSDETTTDATEAATGNAGEFGESDPRDAVEETAADVLPDAEPGDQADGEGDGQARRRRRGRRGGRRRRQGDRPDGEREELAATQPMSEPQAGSKYNGDLPDSETHAATRDHSARPQDPDATTGTRPVQEVAPPVSPINVDVPSVGPDRPVDAVIGVAQESAIEDAASAEAVARAPEPAGTPPPGRWQRDSR